MGCLPTPQAQGLQIQLGNEQKPLVVECFHLGFTLGGYNTKYGGYTSYGSLTPDFVLNIGCCTKYPCGCPPSQDASVNQDDELHVLVRGSCWDLLSNPQLIYI